MFDRFHKRLDKLRVSVPGRYCQCEIEPPKPIEASPGDEIIELPIDLPCGKCGGLRTIVYMQRIIKTTPETKKADPSGSASGEVSG